MASKNQSKKQLEYQKLAKEKEPKRPVFKNCIRAFLVGGASCAFGQILQAVFINYFHFKKEDAGNPTSAVIIIISVLLTGLGVFDKIAQWSGAGTSIPVTGFANSIASAAIEHRTEGYVLGVGGNMFKIAGAVITFGVVSAFVVAIIKMSIIWLGGM
ncbi:MAG: stage V sporulation protein AC [Bacillota bacterium]|nr:stage V sporulation protein AC [Bacillota bacterium]